MKVRNVLFVSQNGLYDHQREMLKRHTVSLRNVVSIKADKLQTERVDHADVMIYFDESKACFRPDIELDMQMLKHAAEMDAKGIKVLYVSKTSSPEVEYRIWSVGKHLTEWGKIGEVWYSFDTKETGPARTEKGRGFNTMNWRHFEKEYILNDKR